VAFARFAMIKEEWKKYGVTHRGRCVGCVMVWCFLFIVPVHAQHRHRKDATAATDTMKVKADMLTLRYKPQAGTLLYDVHTQIDQFVRADGNPLRGELRSDAQLAFHNVAIDYKKGVWTFEEYFTKFDLAGYDLLRDSVSLRESIAVNRITELTYNMKGDELSKIVRDSLKLQNAEAQTNAYFFEPPRMLIPLPEHPVTYGDAWSEHRTDTVFVRDTVNIGTTTGQYRYDVSRTYRLARLLDTTVGDRSSNLGDQSSTVNDRSSASRYYAIIVATDSGTFSGFQTNSATHVTTTASGPIVGTDTTVLNLFSGCVMKRTLDMTIPANVTVSSAAPLIDTLTVHSVVTLDESNATMLKE
jgi:hypothetical protein